MTRVARLRGLRGRRSVCAAILGALGAPLAIVSLAWACAPVGGLRLTPGTGDPGDTITFQVSGFPAGEAVKVRWNSLDGPILAAGTGPEFSGSFIVPAAPKGFYTVGAATADGHAGHTWSPAVFEMMNGTAPPPPPPVAPPPPPPPADVPPPPPPPPAAINPFAPPATPLANTSNAAGDNVITGTDGNDRLVGTPGRDIIKCGKGNDIVTAGGGNDVIDCGAGNDKVDGGAGNDEIRGVGGNDRLTGGSGDDKLLGGDGNDELTGGGGADQLTGGSGVDRLRGNGGKDRLSGGSGRDVIYFGTGDKIVGGGRDRILR